MGSRERRNPLWQHLNPREEQRGKGWALARPPPPAGRFAITRHTCSWVTVGHASWPLPLRAPPNPDFCSSLPKIAMLSSKVGTRAPEAIHRTEGFLLGGHLGEAWLKQKPLTVLLGFCLPPRPRPCINAQAWLRLPAKQGASTPTLQFPDGAPRHTDATHCPNALHSPGPTKLVFRVLLSPIKKQNLHPAGAASPLPVILQGDWHRGILRLQ